MPDKRPTIPREVQIAVLVESGHRCAVCGDPCPLERAHILPWCESRDHSLENLICLCASCHQRADLERWGKKVLHEYKKTPWILRRRVAAGGGESPTLKWWHEFKEEFAKHAPPSETDGCIGYGDPGVEISEMAKRWCAEVARHYDRALPVYRRWKYLLPEESSQNLDRMVEKIRSGRGKWANLLRDPGVTVLGSDLATAALEFHFHRIISDAIDIEFGKAYGNEPSALRRVEHMLDLGYAGEDGEARHHEGRPVK
jgi:hypothetical protein